jgi:fumarate hydratase class II
MVKDIEVDRQRLAAQVDNALLLVTALNPVLGYDRVAQITKTALERNTSPRDAAVALGFLSAADYDRLVDPKAMAGVSAKA